MRSHQTQNIFIILSLLLYSFQIIHVYGFLDPYTVFIANGLPNNSSPLVIHPKSKDNDLGFHTLFMNQNYNFHFRMNLFGRTIFWSTFSWGEKFTSFEVFNLKIADAICLLTNTCYWLVKEDGFYLANVTNPHSIDLRRMRSWDD